MAGCDRGKPVIPVLTLTESSDCKGNGLKGRSDRPSDQDCIQYTWKAGDTLLIKHVNAGFNCCPEGFQVDLYISGDTLIITERENSSMCDCSCLFDLEYHLTGISNGTWWIRVKEQYASQPGDRQILVRAELRKDPDGEFCVTRKKYPWGL